MNVIYYRGKSVLYGLLKDFHVYDMICRAVSFVLHDVIHT